ncbi:MAG TPA: CbiX/SirB N-terminal domain-containing protein [Actinospica sp.]|nr:CbiX/SirB N-terminal domain-containing protein [Actinospica sp.]
MKLLLVAHGSRDPRYAASFEHLCGELRALGHSARVGHLGLCAPDVVEAARLLAREGGSEPMVAVPMFLNHGYHVAHDVPEAVAAARAALGGHESIAAAEPLGPDALLVEAMESRLRELGVWPGDPDTAVILASAGTSDPAARGVLEAVAGDWARTGWHSVSPAYAGAAAPDAARAVAEARAAGARDVVIASCFLAPGLLADRVAAGAPGIPMAAPFATPCDVDPALLRLVLQRAGAVLTAARNARKHGGRPRAGIRSGSALRR